LGRGLAKYHAAAGRIHGSTVRGAQKEPTMDKVLSVLISVGIIIFGAWVVAATIATGWPLVRTLMALFPILTGFISLYDSHLWGRVREG
jgi:hypothetical protein